MSETALRRHFHIVAGGWTQALMGCLWGGVGHAWSVSGLRDFLQQRYERGSTLVTSNLPFDEWTYVFGSERLTSALLDRLTYHVHILEMNGDSFRLSTSKKAQRRQGQKPDENTMPSQTNEGGIATKS